MQIERTYKFVKDKYVKENGLRKDIKIEKIKINLAEFEVKKINGSDLIADWVKLSNKEYEIVEIGFTDDEEYKKFTKPNWLEEIEYNK